MSRFSPLPHSIFSCTLVFMRQMHSTLGVRGIDCQQLKTHLLGTAWTPTVKPGGSSARPCFQWSKRNAPTLHKHVQQSVVLSTNVPLTGEQNTDLKAKQGSLSATTHKEELLSCFSASILAIPGILRPPWPSPSPGQTDGQDCGR